MPSNSDGLFEERPKEKLRIHQEGAADTQDVDLSVEDVRQGHTGDHVRYILGLSVLGALVAMGGAIALFAT